MRLIDADAALKALRKCQTYLYDARDQELKIKLSSAKAAINNLPTIQPEKAQLSQEGTTSDTISRQAAIDALDKRFDSIPMEQTAEVLMLRKDLRELPSTQPEDYTELKREFIRMASYIDVLLECSDAQKETLNGFISRLTEFMPWTERV